MVVGVAEKVDYKELIDKINIHVGYVERFAKEGDLETALKHLQSLVIYLEKLKGEDKNIADLAHDLERHIDEILDHVEKKLLTKGYQLLSQLRKYFIPKKIELIALLQLKKRAAA